MKNKGFTLVELLAVLVILSMISLLAVPNIVNLVKQGKENQFVEEVSEMVSNATYMYKNEKIRKSGVFVNEQTIYIRNINGSVYDKDPYGNTYDENSSITFIESPSSTNPDVYVTSVRIRVGACKDSVNHTGCHYICKTGSDISRDDIKTNSIECS